MKKLSFKWQFRLSIGIFILCFGLAHVFKLGILCNLGWIIYGLLYIVNPAWPPSWDWKDHKKLRLGCRIAGVICVLLGLFSRFNIS